ncbi:chemotaxis-specific protein-glutamate methyltransferase CheB [Phycicoccus sonneratiae]|uniref:Protein-glutamate methylesterase/protein-glutamine glutaminase n=1 Tax=Phycicoccus sonneratiae TaxID=2807628 RepID=A0ABS2CPF2_9MICO|nr:chemotaxis-specific protein-glutamate methyltransferase CheB [Phycicoccus sonneraticus]MBM6401759.1 chemotaxis-specific protein-glutamate methyltransferase CheB [Phycicoccus sonneraticus]
MSTRVVLVDDSPAVRRVVAEALGGLPGVVVAGQARNGREGLDLVDELRPDAVVLDIEMPVMDGIETMRALHRSHPSLPVIMFSTLTERGARATFEALAAGARDYVTKPRSTSGLLESVAIIRRELGERLAALCPPSEPVSVATDPEVGRARRRPGPVALAGRRPAAPSPLAVDHSGRVDVVAIGSSTGGPEALGVLLAGLPRSLSVPVLVVQHMPPVFTRLLAERLDRTGPLPVREAVDGAPLRPGVVHVAPGDLHLTVAGSPAAATIALTSGAKEHHCRPSVDVLFRSLVPVYGRRTLAVVLTGMGTDGAAGAGAVAAAGGVVLAQDEASSVVWGMPGAVVAGGHASRVLPLSTMARTVAGRVAVGRTAPAGGAA